MSHALAWIIIAALLATAEIFAGTFHLLIIAGAMLTGSAGAALGLPVAGQMLLAALAGGGGALALRKVKGRRWQPSAESDPNVNMDIGQKIEVNAEQWVDGRARVIYRGAPWDAELALGVEPAKASFVIREVRGSRLILG